MENNDPKPDEPERPREEREPRDERPRDERPRRDDDERRPRRRRDNEDDYDDRPRRPRRDRRDEFEATDLIIPTNVSGWSMLSCYLGIFGCLIPFLGFFMGIAALIFGFVAFKKKKKTDSYGSVTGDIRAVVGMVCGSLTILGYILAIVISIINQK